MPLDRFRGVTRTRRIKLAAHGHMLSENRLIKPYPKQQQPRRRARQAPLPFRAERRIVSVASRCCHSERNGRSLFLPVRAFADWPAVQRGICCSHFRSHQSPLVARRRIQRGRSAQRRHQLRLHRGKDSPGHGIARMNYDVPSWGDLRTVAPDDFSNAAADSIACHRVSQRFLHADAEAAARPAIGAVENHEPRRSFPRALSIDSLEFGAAYQTSGAGKTLRPTLGSFRWA